MNIGAARRVTTHPALWFACTAGLALYIFAVYLFETPPVPLVVPDTGSYWYSHSMRPLGYTALLHAVYALAGNFKYIPAIQAGTYCLAVLACQGAIWRLTRNIVFASVVAALLLLYHALVFDSLFVMPEQLFIALLVFHVAAAAWALASHSRAALVSMALTAILIISLRPAGTFVLVAILLFCLFWRGNRIFALRWAVLPLAIGMATFMGVGLAVRGIAIERLPGYYAFPYVAYLYDGSGDLPPAAERTIRATLQPYIKGHQEAERDGIVAVTQYEANHFNDIANSLQPNLSKVLPGQDVSALEGRLAMETIERHPLQFLRLVVTTFVGGFHYALVTWPINATVIRDNYHGLSGPIRVVSKMVGGLGSFDVDTDGSRYGLVRDYPLPQLPMISGWLWWALIIWFWVTAAVSISIAVFGEPSKLGFFTAYTSTLAIGGYLFIAVTTVIIARYTAPLDAFIIVTIASGALEGLRVMRGIIRRVYERPNRTLAPAM